MTFFTAWKVFGLIGVLLALLAYWLGSNGGKT